jgi:hypothetical protein
MNTLTPDEDAIRATWRWLAHSAHGVSELRVIRPGGGIIGIGFFDDEDAFVRECVRTNAAGNVYVGIQPRPRRLFEAAANVVRPLKTGASSKDIELITATIIDIDPARPKNTASTNAELGLAVAAAESTASWCESEGLVRPRLMMSGNGAQLWFALPPTALDGDRRERLQAGLKSFEAKIRERVQSDTVHVDSIHDVARIIKVIGTVSHKGDGQGDRPHRVSAGLTGFERVEDAALLACLDVDPTQELPLVPPTASLPIATTGTAKAKRTSEGEFDWEHPVEMCGPIQRLWEQGIEDRSVAIFNMVRFFAHKGLSLDEITELVLEYDRRGLGKLKGRDGVAYIKKSHEKVLATARDDGSIAPPCHSLQSLGFCRVNREPTARCDLYDKAITRVTMPSAIDDEEAAPESNDEAMQGAIFEDASCYYCMTARDETKVISSFTIEPTMRVVTEDGELILGDALTDKGGKIPGLRLPLSAFHSKRDLIRQLPSADLQWTGSDNNVQGLLRILARRPVPHRPGSNMLGEYKKGDHHVWLGPDCAIGKDGFIEPPPVVFVPNGGSLDKRVSYVKTDEDTFLEVAVTVFRYLPQLNKPEVILPVLGWFFATPMKPSFMRTVGSFPSLFVWGTQGSGKSSLCIDIMWPLFGIRDAEPYSATETEFALIKLLTSTCSVPVFIDEYKPYDMQRQRLNTLHRYLRRLYRGETEERGRPDLKVNSYHLQAPVCVAGETRPTEAALLERIITSNPEKATLKEMSGYQEAFRKLRSINLVLFAPRYIQFCLGRDFDADLKVAREVAKALFNGRKAPLRIAENITAMLLGVHLFEEFAKHCGCELPDDLGAEVAVSAVLDDVLETDYGVKNALDHFIEMLGVMAVQRYLKPHLHYAFDAGRLAIHLESAYDAFRVHAKRVDYEGEIVDLKSLRRLIVENKKQYGFVVAESERVNFESGRRRAVLIDFTKTNVVTADDFPMPKENSSNGDYEGVRAWNDF